MKQILCFILLVPPLIFSACANPGTPDGGPYDETPPRVMRSTPSFGQVDDKMKRIDIYFNELVRLDNASEKVVVSPPQMNMPDIVSMGKYIRIKLQDSLKANTTYTIDFSDAIVDNDEGNPLGNYSFVFSTGDSIDSMQVSGHVLNAENLEPVKGILVGLQSDTTDTAFTKKPFLRVARTDGRGHFDIRGVAPGIYKVYALQDADGNFCYNQKSEMLAYQKATIKTNCFPDVRMDTVWKDSMHVDSIKKVPYVHYTPENVVLLAFTESYANRHLLKTERQVPEHFEVYFTGPSKELPKIKGLNFKSDRNTFAVEHSVGNDTISYWIKDTTLAYCDTLRAQYTYLENDSVGNLVEKTDTIDFVPKVTHAKQLKWSEADHKKWKKEQERRKKKGQPYEEIPPVVPLEVEYKNGSLAPNENMFFKVKEPLAKIDTGHIHLYLKHDSVMQEAPYIFQQDGVSILAYKMYAEWRPEQKYKVVIDSAAFVSIYGHACKKVEFDFIVPSLDSYSSLFFTLNGVQDTTAMVELLSSADKVVNIVRSKHGRADFYFIKPGNYYARLFIDKNGNGKWDEGNFGNGILPEETYYYPGKLVLKARWDVSQDWDIHSVPLIHQKPQEITKQKPDKAKQIQNRNAERERKKH